LLVDAWWAVMLPNVRRPLIELVADLLILVVVLYPLWWLGQ
jgi:hypothetical protein